MTKQLLNKMIEITDISHSKYGQVGKIVRYNTSKKNGVLYLVHMTLLHAKIYLKLNQFKVKGK